MKSAMQKFTEKIVSMMKAEKLFETQGGPIILSQVRKTAHLVSLIFLKMGLKNYIKYVFSFLRRSVVNLIDMCRSILLICAGQS